MCWKFSIRCTIRSEIHSVIDLRFKKRLLIWKRANQRFVPKRSTRSILSRAVKAEDRSEREETMAASRKKEKKKSNVAKRINPRWHRFGDGIERKKTKSRERGGKKTDKKKGEGKIRRRIVEKGTRININIQKLQNLESVRWGSHIHITMYICIYVYMYICITNVYIEIQKEIKKEKEIERENRERERKREREGERKREMQQ